jgi:two-component sensor histidine kinase
MRIFYVFLFNAICFINFAQSSSKQDSLKRILNSKISDKDKFQTAYDIANGYERNQPDSARKFLDLALPIAQKTNNKKDLGRWYMKSAALQRDRTNYEEAINSCQKAIGYFESINDKVGVGRVYNTLGLTYKKMGDAQKVEVITRKGLEYALKSVQILESEKDTTSIGSSYNNLGIIYRDLKEFENAKKAYLSGLKSKNAQYYGTLNANLGQLIIDNDKNYDEAILYLKKALQIHEKNSDKNGIEHVYRNLGLSYQRKKDYKQALEYGQKSLEIALQIKDVHRLFNSYKVLAETQEAAGLYKEAILSLKTFKKLEDSTLKAEKFKAIAEMETKYETEKKEIQIKALDKENSLKNKQLLWAIIGLSVLGILLVISLWLYQKLKERNQKIETQSKQLSNLMKELHHRVKNNLAMVSSLLSIQSRKLEDKEAAKAVREGQLRVQAMSMIHQRLYKTDDISTLNMQSYLKDLAENLIQIYGFSKSDFNLEIQTENPELDIDLAIPIGLIVNELITNAMKYAYVEIKKPSLKIDFKNLNGIFLKIKDNGIGFDFTQKKKNGFGQDMIVGLTKQIGGKSNFYNENGTVFELEVAK